MSNFNRVFLMGNLTKDPELRYTPKGTAVADIRMAISREYSTGPGTERRKETTFVDVTFWGRQAEVVCEYLRKGSPLFVEGRLTFDEWEGKDGQKRSRLRVVAENFQFIGGRGGGGGADTGEGGADYGQNYRRESEAGGGPPEDGPDSYSSSAPRSRGAGFGGGARPGAATAGTRPAQEMGGASDEESAPDEDSEIPF